jgi:hypothetical protein
MKEYGINTLESAKAPSKIVAFLFITRIFCILYCIQIIYSHGHFKFYFLDQR